MFLSPFYKDNVQQSIYLGVTKHDFYDMWERAFTGFQTPRKGSIGLIQVKA